jgi:UDP-N-acetylmuramate: L-alanyl-gamma-D-glutamyl-meso-diaminopimelate ligase
LKIYDSHGNAYQPGVFGRHNMENLEAAKRVCLAVGVPEVTIYRAFESFTGASMRLQYLVKQPDRAVLRDFAHAPSKVRATVNAVREKFQDKKVTAVVELHTFSSLNKAFMPEYRGALDSADRGIVYFSPHTVAMKKLEDIDPSEVMEHFGGDVEVLTDAEALQKVLKHDDADVHLLMSSGQFGGIDLNELYQTESV